MTIDLNCDMGEGMDHDAELMPLISSTNIACGFHAGDEDTMKRTIELALKYQVAIGAHPGFDDKASFGRKELHLSTPEIIDLVATQIEALKKIASAFHTSLHHVKPHGALYNMAAKNSVLAHAVAQAVKESGSNLVLYGQSGSFLISEAKKVGLQTAAEVFADRTYQEDGNLTPRSSPHALITEKEKSVDQVLQMVKHQSVTSTNNKSVPVLAQTICIHGDGIHAVSFAENIVAALKKNHIDIQAI